MIRREIFHLPHSTNLNLTPELIVIQDPVITADGFTYERKNIVAWFARGKKTSPMTGAALPDLNIAPNLALRHRIEEWEKANCGSKGLEKAIWEISGEAMRAPASEILEDLRQLTRLIQRYALLRAPSEGDFLFAKLESKFPEGKHPDVARAIVKLRTVHQLRCEWSIEQEKAKYGEAKNSKEADEDGGRKGKVGGGRIDPGWSEAGPSWSEKGPMKADPARPTSTRFTTTLQ